jgi:exosortase
MDAVENEAPARPPAGPPASFWAEFQDYWRRVPDKGLFLTLLAGWCALFQLAGISSFNFETVRPSLFEWLYHAWNAPALDSSQGNLIPFVVAVLLWVRRRELAASITGLWWPGLAVVGLALLIHILGFLAQQQRVSVIALFLGIYGLAGVVWGWRTMRASFFPMVLFAFCMPLGTFAEELTLPLRLLATSVTRMVCHGLLGIGVVQDGTKLLDPLGQYQYDVAAACSGIHSFVALLAVTLIFSWLTYRTFWRRGLIVALTLPLVVLCNVVRLVVIILANQAFGHEAGDFVHEWFGFVTYLVAIGCLLVVARWLKEKQLPENA